MVPVAPFAQKKSGDTITRQPAGNLVLTHSSCLANSALTPRDWSNSAWNGLQPGVLGEAFFTGTVGNLIGDRAAELQRYTSRL